MMNKPIRTLLAAALLAFASPSLVFAQSSPWFKTDGADIRLIALPAADGNRLDAGLQIELKPGWKTYWRAPGASGLPPQVSFQGSQNVADTRMDFPVPTTFGSRDNLTAGYAAPVTFPITVEPLFADRPVTLKAQGVIGLCEEICIPVQFSLELQANSQGVSDRDVASTLLAARSNMMKATRADFRVNKAHVTGMGSQRMLVVEAQVPAGISEASLFVEGPGDWYLTPVRSDSVNEGKAAFSMSLAQIPARADATGTLLRLSLVANGEGVTEEITPSAID